MGVFLGRAAPHRPNTPPPPPPPPPPPSPHPGGPPSPPPPPPPPSATDYPTSELLLEFDPHRGKEVTC
ncbi:hypothetical protein [Nocardia abscessus]|uniref:hypothetical protein n=1 Tax=Nocardia abscessus TaxID=120957 RepID=UPI002454C0B6|nr:hypothetical protein [Nocardia abscessus]